MGEAKRRKEELRKHVHREIESGLAPITDAEVALARHVTSLTYQTLPRAPREQIEYMRMQRNDCHQNAISYSKLDPEGKSRAVHGWWKQGDHYVLHSVVEREGSMFCITPMPFGHSSELDFAEDPTLTVEEDGEVRSFQWAGGDAPIRVAADPAKLREHLTAMKKRIENGEDAIEVARDPRYMTL